MDISALFLITLTALVQEDIACIVAGLAAARGALDWRFAMLACVVGTISIDMFWFLMGRYLGRWTLTHPPLNWFLSPRKLDLAITWLSRRGSFLMLTSRFAPGLRCPLQFAAGTLHTPLGPAVASVVIASLIYVPLLFAGAYLIGEALLDRLASVERYALTGVVLAGMLGLGWCLKRALRAKPSTSAGQFFSGHDSSTENGRVPSI